MTLERLNQHLTLLEQVREARELLESLRLKVAPRTASLDGMPHAPGVSDRVGDLAVEIADVSDHVQHLEKQIEADALEVQGFIESIQDLQTRLIFRLRFMRGLQWGEVAGIIGGYTSVEGIKSTCYRYLRKVK